VVSFSVNGDSSYWNYQAPSQASVSIIESTTGNGLVGKSSSSGVETLLRLDPSGNATADTWTGSQIDYLFGQLWLGDALNGGLAQFAAPGVQEAVGPSTRAGGDPQHNGTTDPGLVLVGTQDCHRVNAQQTILSRFPTYDLRTPADKSQTPKQKYTVFEFIPAFKVSCGLPGYLGVYPCSYADGNTFAYNEYADELDAGVGFLGFTAYQYFLYGLPNQRLFGVKQIYRTLPGGSLTPKNGWNLLSVQPGTDPLIDGNPDPWLAPWDGQASSCIAIGKYFR
jgi:hypothetical protein